MGDTDMLLAALERIYESQSELNLRLTKINEDHELRLRAAESSILKFKTLGALFGTLLSFLGWGALRGQLPLE